MRLPPAEVSSAVLRGLTGQHKAFFRGDRVVVGDRFVDVSAAHLQPIDAGVIMPVTRGLVDAYAQRELHCDQAVHRDTRPLPPIAGWLFDAFEQFRVESLVPTQWPGMRSNLREHFEAWAHGFVQSVLFESVRGKVLLAALVVVRARVLDEPIDEAMQESLESPRIRLAPVLGRQLRELRNARTHQSEYARIAGALAQAIDALLDALGNDPSTSATQKMQEQQTLRLLLRPMQAQGDASSSAVAGRGRWFDTEQAQYKVFTRAYDRQIDARELARAARLTELREQLDREIARIGIHWHRLARLAQARWARPERDGWQDGQEQGRIDARRLARLVSSPQERHLFQMERERLKTDCSVTLLIDCSGSMRQHQWRMACLADVTVRALESIGIACEVLGFTTSAWNGGRALRDWKAQLSPAQPGRMNEQLHIVFKAAEVPWRKARLSMAALLLDHIYREGVDGEAVLWACERARSVAASRHGVLVFSDGCPMDTATSMANDEAYLDHHLQWVVSRQQAQGDLQIAAVGLGQDLSLYYAKHRLLDLDRSLHWASFETVIDLLDPQQR
jgi:cobaltochelatase CobT